MKKIVILSALQIFTPESGGQLRTAQLAHSLQQLNQDNQTEVIIYSMTGRKKDYISLKKSSYTIINNSLKEFVNRNILWGILQKLSYFFNLPPYWVYYLLKIHTPKRLSKELENADLLIADFPFTASIFKNFKKSKWLNTHNAEFELWKHSDFHQKWVKNIEINSMKQAEQVLFCSESDKNTLLSLLARTVEFEIVPNAIQKSFSFESEAEKQKFKKALGISKNKKIFIFTGSQFLPNQKAFTFLKSFCEKNETALLNLNILILIVGTVSLDKVNFEHFKVLGKVEEVSRYISLADFGLNAVTEGSGVNVKMIEFLSYHLPILSTHVGARGLSLENATDFIEFNYDNLLIKLQLAVTLDSDKLITMSNSAWQKNQSQLSMLPSLEKALKKNKAVL